VSAETARLSALEPDLRRRLRQVVADELGLEVSEIGWQRDLDELGVDSAARAMLCVAIEEELGVTLDERAFGSARTLSDFVAGMRAGRL
jgi:acyl carrier protein